MMVFLVLILIQLKVFAIGLSSTSDPDRFTGDVIQFAIPAISLSIAAYKKDNKGTVQFVKTMVVNQIATEVLKRSFNNVVVGGTRLGHRPDGGDKNFPSGHTSAVFASAWHIQKRYGIKYSAIPLMMATFTGYSRIDEKRHTPASVIAGALVGILSAEFFTTRINNQNLSLVAGYDGYRVATLTFNMKL